MELCGRRLEKIITSAEISNRVKELAQEIDRDYDGERIHVIGVLSGALFFLSDLLREIKRPIELDFVRISSYGNQTEPITPELSNNINTPLEGRHVLLVEDIVDTGQTLSLIMERINRDGPSSVRVCVLIDKSERRIENVPVSYTGFTVKDGFVVGYGMDLGEKGRNLRDIYKVI